jgi:hypothetical protein
VQLTPDESHWDWLPAHVSITTLTFFKGDTNAAYAGLRQRLKALVAANPWLCGRIIKVPGAPRESCCELWVPKVPDYSTLIAEMESEQLVPGQVRVSMRLVCATPRAARTRRSPSPRNFAHKWLNGLTGSFLYPAEERPQFDRKTLSIPRMTILVAGPVCLQDPSS